ncbi:thiol reductant ABC exporter subunit CydC [Anaerobacillus alkaliphilus]|uniref:Thiol reductant ABC exporter subunit CydC n=1 Tax=Anaerobacillus alkaliphilus TaxID=1548597 RepID=A0A4Q0VPB1_9BACI|nr:thiol reductant ABC exporter subunit CydC [Anaerobacillus alkaliphilus]RXI97891.1 thiol reductant ABC exporter subunit CydC [Anaerobacillus alkaliphilus]
MELRTVIKLIMSEKRDLLLSILFGFLAAISSVALFADSGYLISKAALLPPLYVLTMTIAFLKLFSVMRALSRYAERYFSHRATFTILSRLRTYFFNKLEPHAATIFHNYRSGDLLARIVGDVESLQHFFLRVYYPPVVMVAVFLVTLVFTLLFSPAITLVLFSGLIVTGFLLPFFFAQLQKQKKTIVREVRGRLSTETTELMQGFLDLKLYQKLQEREDQLVRTANSYLACQAASSKKALTSQALQQWVALFTTWLVVCLGAIFILEQKLDPVFLAMLVLIGLTVFETATPMAVFPIHFVDSKTAASRLFSVVNEKENSKDSNNSIETDTIPSIEVKNLSYQFPGSSRPTLKNVNCTIPAGSKTALVGPSGSGKSTFLGILLKFYDDYQGEIRIAGQQFSKLDEEVLWKAVNPVLQSNHYFYGTVRENLQIAKESASDGEMKTVLAKVYLDNLSLDSLILEKGENLSGGEKQRLALARAMLKGSHLWLLDEPTSSLDAITEKQIIDEIFTEYADDTMVFVSHRLYGLEKFDQILVMEAGEIIEAGTYEQLMNKKGYFYELKQIESRLFYA